MPGAPPFVSTRFKAVSRFCRSHIRSHTFSPSSLDVPLFSAANCSTLWLSLEGFTFALPPAVTPSGVFCFPCSFCELLKFLSSLSFCPSHADGRDTMASADSCHLKPTSRLGLRFFFFAWRQVSPDKNVDLLRALARFTALPLDDSDLVILCPLVQTHSLISGLCSSSRGFAWGFLQTSPRGDALAFG